MGANVNYQDIEAAEVEQVLQKQDIVVIDTRDALAQSKGQLPNAQDATDPLIHGLVQKRHSDPPVLVYCYHGNSSRVLCSFLGQLGLTQVYNLAGGWQAYQSRQQSQSGLSSADYEWLLCHGFDPDNCNSRVEQGMSPLMLAALEGRLERVETLLAAGADPNLVNDDEHNALWFACVNGDNAIVERLIAHDSDINNRNVNGVTCAIYAASTGKLEVLKKLINAGANLGIRTHDGYHALDSASTLPILRFLKPLMQKAG